MNNFRDKLCPENIQLLAEIERSIPVEFEAWPQNYWSTKITHDKKRGVVYYPTEFSDAKVAHELLHLKIGLVMGDNIALQEEINNYCIELPILLYLFQHQVCEHLLNSYEHIKIFADYKKMGFADKDFFDHDEDAQSMRNNFFETIKHKRIFDKYQYDPFLLMQYLCLTISFLSHPYKDLKPELKILKREDKSLFEIIQKYWERILNIPITPTGKLLMDKEHKTFIQKMAAWASTRKFNLQI